ncbi:hypothetical protein DB346_20925 [Verrucomicrobia bacterium LW23]|nr:hypothetical protein DB346_20925 [Verrucomicrobia bacterium LW23]
MDLIVNPGPYGQWLSFQLCYGKPWTQNAVMWNAPDSVAHYRVDDGEGDASSNRTPLLAPGGTCDTAALITDFMARAGELDPALRQFVVEKIAQLGRSQLQTGGRGQPG